MVNKKSLYILLGLSVCFLAGCGNIQKETLFVDMEMEQAADIPENTLPETESPETKPVFGTIQENPSTENLPQEESGFIPEPSVGEPVYDPCDYMELDDYYTRSFRSKLEKRIPTEEEIDAYIEDIFHDISNTYRNSSGIIQPDSIIEIEYSLYSDEKETSSPKTSLFEMGAGYLPKKTEEKLIGQKAGFETEVPYEDIFPDENENITVKLKILSIRSFYPVDDESISIITQNRFLNLSTYREYVREELQEQYDMENEDIWAYDYLNALSKMGHAKILSYPEDALAFQKDIQLRIWQDEFPGFAVTDDILEMCEEEAKNRMYIEMAVRMISKEQDIHLTKEEYEHEIKRMKQQNHIETDEQWDHFKEIYGEDYIWQMAMFYKLSRTMMIDRDYLKK